MALPLDAAKSGWIFAQGNQTAELWITALHFTEL